MAPGGGRGAQTARTDAYTNAPGGFSAVCFAQIVGYCNHQLRQLFVNNKETKTTQATKEMELRFSLHWTQPASDFPAEHQGC